MSFRVVWRCRRSASCAASIRPDQRRIITAIERFSRTGEGDVRRLTGVSPPQHRLRVGPWRVRFALDREVQALEVLHVLPRGKAYR